MAWTFFVINKRNIDILHERIAKLVAQDDVDTLHEEIIHLVEI